MHRPFLKKILWILTFSQFTLFWITITVVASEEKNNCLILRLSIIYILLQGVSLLFTPPLQHYVFALFFMSTYTLHSLIYVNISLLPFIFKFNLYSTAMENRFWILHIIQQFFILILNQKSLVYFISYFPRIFLILWFSIMAIIMCMCEDS